MQIRQLQVFVTVCEGGSFTSAARKLGVSQPALSRMVRDLESRQGVRLFERTGRGVRPTEAGAVFLARARRILEELDSLKSDMDRLAGVDQGEVRVSIPLRVGISVLVPFMQRFSQQFPNAKIQVVENLNLVTQELLSSGEINVGVFYTPPTPAGVEIEAIGVESLFLVGRADMVTAGCETITLAEAADLPLLLPSREAHYFKFIAEAFGAAGYSPQVVRAIDTLNGLIAFALEGEGATILPFSSVSKEVEQKLVVARKLVDPVIARRICLATSRQDKTKLVRGTASLLKQVMVQYRDRMKWTEEVDGVVSAFE